MPCHVSKKNTYSLNVLKVTSTKYICIFVFRHRNNAYSRQGCSCDGLSSCVDEASAAMCWPIRVNAICGVHHLSNCHKAHSCINTSIRDQNLVCTSSTPNSAKPSAGSVLAAKLVLFTSKFLELSSILSRHSKRPRRPQEISRILNDK